MFTRLLQKTYLYGNLLVLLCLTSTSATGAADSSLIDHHKKNATQLKLAIAYLTGKGARKDEPSGVALLLPLAKQEDTEALFHLGNCCYHGRGTARDVKEAIAYYTRAAEGGHAKSQFNLGLLHERDKDIKQALEWYGRAAAQGDIYAQKKILSLENNLDKKVEAITVAPAPASPPSNLPIPMVSTSSPSPEALYAQALARKKDKKQYLRLLHQAAAAGHAPAQCRLGFLHDAGQRVERDIKEAIMWYRKAADREDGDAEAQFNLGDCYSTGEGVEQDNKLAFDWYSRAAAHNFPKALFNIAVSFHQGRGVGKDMALALEWYGKAAAENSPEAQFNLGLYWNRGDGGTPDPVQAVAWYQRAAKQGYAPALYHLGLCYKTGQGVEQDDKQAAQLFRKAAAKGCREAESYLPKHKEPYDIEDHLP